MKNGDNVRIGDAEYSDAQKQQLIDEYNVRKASRARSGAIQTLLCVILLCADAAVTAVLYAISALKPLVYTFLSKPDTSSASPTFTPMTPDAADPNELFAIGAVLFAIAAVKIIFAASCGVFAAAKTGICAATASAGSVFFIVNLVFSAITLAYPESYSDPASVVFLAANVVFTLTAALCVYLAVFKKDMKEYAETANKK